MTPALRAPDAGPDRSGPLARLAAAMVGAVAVAVALAGLGNDLVQDDRVLLIQNSRMHSLGHWRELVGRPYWPPPWTEDLWRPVTSLWLALQYQAGQGAPWIFRLVSALLHGAVAVALFGLGRRLAPGPVALGAALLFAVHPVHVEALALAVGQAELLVALLSILVVGHYLRRRLGGDGRLGTGDWALVGAGCLVAALTKEHGLVLPLLLAAGELLLVRREGRGRWRHLWGGYAALVGLAVLVLQVRGLVLQGDLVGSFTAEALAGLSLGQRALTMLAVAPEWVRLLLWPARLSADYSPAQLVASEGFGARELLGLLLVLGVMGSVLALRRTRPLAAFGLAWTAVALVPVSNVLVPTGILLAERTLFLPSVGVVLALAGIAAPLWTGAPAPRRRIQAVIAVVAIALVVAGAARSVPRFGAFRSEAAYVAQTVQDAPRSFRAQRAWGEQLFLAGRREEGIAAYRLATSYAPAAERWRVRNDLARRYFEEDRAALAVEELVASREENPSEQETWNYLILGLLNLGEHGLALREAESALARGYAVDVFGDLRALADTALKVGVPPGAIRVRVVRGRE